MSQPVTVIAEAGVNHNGDLARAKAMIHAAKTAGADIVKFQAFTTEKTVSRQARTASYQATNTGITSQFDLIKGLEFSLEQFAELAGECRDVGIPFLATPLRLGHGRRPDRYGHAGDQSAVGRGRQHRGAQGFRRQGPAHLAVDRHVLLGRGRGRRAPCCARAARRISYSCIARPSIPAPPATLNLLAIRTLADRFGVTVGYSDHSLGDTASLAAVALGRPGHREAFHPGSPPTRPRTTWPPWSPMS